VPPVKTAGGRAELWRELWEISTIVPDLADWNNRRQAYTVVLYSIEPLDIKPLHLIDTVERPPPLHGMVKFEGSNFPIDV
jgi:hypothetical protein